MDENALFPIYGVWHVPFWQTTAFYIAVASFGGVVVLFFVLYGIKKFRASKQKKRLPWDRALDEFAQVEQLLAGKGILGKTFYFKLTWIFKRYLSERYGFEVYGKTDGELLLHLEGSGLASDLTQELAVIFEGSTAIKFANEQAMHDRMKRDLVASIEFIKKTVPIVEKNNK